MNINELFEIPFGNGAIVRAKGRRLERLIVCDVSCRRITKTPMTPFPVGESMLFFFENQLNWHTIEVPSLAQLVLQETLVGIFHILGQVAEEHELWRAAFQLSDVLDAQETSTRGGRQRHGVDDFQHLVVQLADGDAALAVLVDLVRGL